MIQEQDVVSIPLAAAVTKLDQPGIAERTLMTFFSVAFAFLSLYVFLLYSDLLGRVGLLSKFLAKILAVVESGNSLFVGFGVCALFGLVAAVYQWKKPQLAAWEKVDYWTTTVIRYFLAYIFLTYGFAKIFHDQFNTPLSVMDTRLGDVSGYWLTWHFFGYSYAYTLFVACSQILSSFLLFFRRTTTLGAMILLPIIANIVFMNFAYGIPVKMFSSIFLILTLFLLAQDARRIKALVWDNQSIGKPAFPVLRKGPGLLVLKYLVIAIAVGTTSYQMHSSYTAFAKTTTSLAGTWTVQEYKVNGQLLPQSDPSAWTKFYVESDTMVETKHGDQKASMFYSMEKPVLDSAKQTIDLTRGMGKRKKSYFRGSYHLKPDGTLTIDGHDVKGAAIQATLKRVKN